MLVPEVLRLLALARGSSSSSSSNSGTAGAEVPGGSGHPISGEALQGGSDGGSASGAEHAADPGLLRVRHVLVLALHRALVAGSDAAGAGKVGAGAGKAGRGAAAKGHPGVAPAALARGLVSASFPELRATLPLLLQLSGAESGGEEGGGALADWEVRASECVELGTGHERAGLPKEGHAAALSTAAQATHAALLCAALHAAMSAAPELDAPQQLGGSDGGAGAVEAPPPASATKTRGGRSAPQQQQQQQQQQLVQPSGAQTDDRAGQQVPSVREMFVGLGELQPGAAFVGHLSLLLDKALPQLERRVGFLAGLYAAPEDTVRGEEGGMRKGAGGWMMSRMGEVVGAPQHSLSGAAVRSEDVQWGCTFPGAVPAAADRAGHASPAGKRSSAAGSSSCKSFSQITGRTFQGVSPALHLLVIEHLATEQAR